MVAVGSAVLDRHHRKPRRGGREELLSRLCRADSQPLSALAGAAGSADSAAPAVFFCPPLVRVFLSAG
ncbi:hypothetical protein TM51_15161 [Thermobifida fusca TM51]|uniref:Uncharacterized protein n=1 Tax=Thermobifida fusca TM51 TaxID=1169414 RepID=A0A9P2WNZ4_THEFU|nr:hypothetical protein TM51_15161 [Thermobifida fusca TM51]MBO2530039.1 hypothetical protein [Thermobifida sp.]PPS94923.1 hypothetical protein BH05_04005 [Thermobifida fusca]